jgi:hypothetical protein
MLRTCLVIRNTTCSHPLAIAEQRDGLVTLQAQLVTNGRTDFRIQTLTEPQLIEAIRQLQADETCDVCRPLPEGIHP